MHVEILADSHLATARLVDLTTTCDSASWAVAWATPNPVLDAMAKSLSKFTHLVVGTHGYVTDPAVLAEFWPAPNVKVMLPKGKLFHPKVYLFRHGDNWTAVVGSHNLTGAAFSSNREFSTVIRGHIDEPVMQGFFNYIAAAHATAEPYDEDWLTQYKAFFHQATRHRNMLESDMPSPKKKAAASTLSLDRPEPQMSWFRYVAEVRREVRHDIKERLAVLAYARAAFARTSFDRMTDAERLNIGGIASPSAMAAAELDTALFGTMAVSPAFGHTIKNNAAGFAAALAYIPPHGDVEREAFQAYIATFMAAYDSDLRAGGGIGNATRLLAMYRPDQFLGINGGNSQTVRAAFRLKRQISVESYWDDIILPIRSTEWWNAPPPADLLELQIWLGRAALLDAVYYNGTK